MPEQTELLDAWLGLGSNLGDRAALLHRAIRDLSAFATVLAVSPFYQTAPVGLTEQPAFLNAAAHIQTRLPPEDLMARLLAVERAAGRDRASATPNGPRTLDLDVLLLSRAGRPLVITSPALTVPHPRLRERRFVLAPLAAIAPDYVHPIGKRTVAALLAALPRQRPDDAANAPSGVALWRG